MLLDHIQGHNVVVLTLSALLEILVKDKLVLGIIGSGVDLLVLLVLFTRAHALLGLYDGIERAGSALLGKQGRLVLLLLSLDILRSLSRVIVGLLG